MTTQVAVIHGRRAFLLAAAAAPTPTGGTGGWLTTSSTADGITLSFRSKGFAELSVRVDLAQACDG